jgi:hypothetical protein
MHSMKPRDIFRLAVRILGLIALYQAIRTIAPIWHGPGAAVMPTIFTTAGYVAAAWWLVRGAQVLVKRAYPDTDAAPPTGSEVGRGVIARIDA